MKNLKISLTTIVLLIFALACSNDEPAEQQSVKPIEGATEVEVSVILPSGSNLDLTTTEIVSLGESFKVPASGKTKIYVAPGNRSFVSLQDKNGEVIFMGFITNEEKELSIASSGKAALYFGLGTIFQVEQTKETYFKDYNSQKEIIAFNEAITPIFISDKYFLKSDTFKNLVKNTIIELTSLKEITSKTNKVKDVIVNDTDEKSGVKVTNEGPLSIGFQSQSRRRSYAYIYKIASKPIGSNSFTTVPRALVNQTEISRSDGFTSTLGTFWTGATGKGQELFIKDTPAISLSLSDDESAAKFEVKVIGLSCEGNPTEGMSEEEKKKYNDMQMDYFVFDLILPALGTALGAESFDSTGGELFKTAVVSALGSSATEEVSKGNFKKAANDFMGEFIKGNLSSTLDNVLETIVQFSDLDNIDLGVGGTAKIFKPLAVIDALLQLNDFIRLQASACTSNAIEKWEVIASRSTNINLLPKESIIRPGSSQTLELKISSDGQLGTGQSYEMEWTTSGNYGSLNNGSVDFTNSSKTVIYTANPFLSYDNAEDDVSVKLYIKDDKGNKTLLGEDNAIVKIAKNKYKIVPENPYLKGGDFVNLSVVDFEGNPIPNPPTGSIKIEWGTTGTYGKYDGVTNYYNAPNQNAGPTYECQDYNTKTGIENINAKIYLYSSEGKKLIDEVKGIININNDPNVKFVNVSIVEKTVGISFTIDAVFKIPSDKDAKTYKIEVLEMNPDSSPSRKGMTYTWTPTSYDNAKIKIDGDNFVFYGMDYGAGVHVSNGPGIAQAKAFYAGVTGKAKVTITK